MKLHLLRHAKTSSFSNSGKDIDRELLPKGIKQSIALNTFFSGLDSIEVIWCSSAVRTKETSNLILSDKHPKPDICEDLYLTSLQFLLQKLWNFKSNSELLIIGHNFGISDLVNYFTDTKIILGTAEYVCIEFSCDSWEETSKGTGIIIDQYRPKVSS